MLRKGEPSDEQVVLRAPTEGEPSEEKVVLRIIETRRLISPATPGNWDLLIYPLFLSCTFASFFMLPPYPCCQSTYISLSVCNVVLVVSNM